MFNRIFLVLALFLGTGLSAAEVAATLIKAVGSGQVFLAGGGNADFKAGTLLRAGSRIVTGEGALAQLMMDDGSRVSIGPNTDLTLTLVKPPKGTQVIRQKPPEKKGTDAGSATAPRDKTGGEMSGDPYAASGSGGGNVPKK